MMIRHLAREILVVKLWFFRHPNTGKIRRALTKSKSKEELLTQINISQNIMEVRVKLKLR
jgi:hypothetical protein